MKNIIATWIIDENYLAPAYVSIASFKKHIDIPIIIYFDGNIPEDVENTFKKIGSNITFQTITQKPYNNSIFSKQIENRLKRIEIARDTSNTTMMLIDADTAFSFGSERMIQSINKEKILNPKKPIIWGVVEYEYAADAWLYFKRTKVNGETYLTLLEDKIIAF